MELNFGSRCWYTWIVTLKTQIIATQRNELTNSKIFSFGDLLLAIHINSSQSCIQWLHVTGFFFWKRISTYLIIISFRTKAWNWQSRSLNPVSRWLGIETSKDAFLGTIFLSPSCIMPFFSLVGFDRTPSRKNFRTNIRWVPVNLNTVRRPAVLTCPGRKRYFSVN